MEGRESPGNDVLVDYTGTDTHTDILDMLHCLCSGFASVQHLLGELPDHLTVIPYLSNINNLQGTLWIQAEMHKGLRNCLTIKLKEQTT